MEVLNAGAKISGGDARWVMALSGLPVPQRTGSPKTPPTWHHYQISGSPYQPMKVLKIKTLSKAVA